MSLINKMLQELDKRNGGSGGDVGAISDGVRPVARRRVGSDLFWWIMAAMMLSMIGWLSWVMWQLTPHSVVTELAYKQSARGSVVQAGDSSVSTPPVVTTGADIGQVQQGGAGQQADSAASSTLNASGSSGSKPQIDMLKLATAITTPIPQRPRRAGVAEPGGRPIAKSEAESRPSAGGRGEGQRRSAGNAGAQEQAELDYRRGVALANQGKLAESVEALRAVLLVDALHEPARQSLVSLLIDQRRFDDALQALRQGLELNPRNGGLATLMARVLVERRELDAALGVLKKFAPAGGSVEHHALAGALLQRLGRNADAVDEYQSALRLAPGAGAQTGVLLIGLAISQDGAGRRAESVETLRRAKSSGQLSAELSAFVDQQLRAGP